MLIDNLTKYGLPRDYIDILRERGIRELNPVQVDSINKGLFSGVNLVVSTPTASGKTLIAEMALIKTYLEGKIGVYLTPLRALANEKYSEFRKLEKLGVEIGISTGDYDQPAEDLGEYDIIVATYERFDSLMRLKPSWVNRIRLVIIDELHNVNDPERGPIIEIIIARLLRQGTRIIGLSATIGNPVELAKWIQGQLVSIEWRPVKLIEGVFNKRRDEIVFSDGRREEVIGESGDDVIDLVLHNLRRDHQTLVFIHNRKRVEELAGETASILKQSTSRELSKLLDELDTAPTRYEREVLRELVIRGVAFHHAGLSHVSRNVIENAFRERLLRVVYATPTLAAGVNLPARRVLVSIKRYDPFRGRRVSISISEYKQMAGRAGRPRYDQVGESIIIDAPSLSEGLRYIYSKPEYVDGRLFNERSLRIHVLSTIVSREASNVKDIATLLKNTFSVVKSPSVDVDKSVEGVLSLLRELNMISGPSEDLKPTPLGKITSYSYIDPLTVDIFIKHKPRVFSELYVLHLVALTPDFTRVNVYIPNRLLISAEETAESYLASGLIMPDTSDYYDHEDWLRGFIYAITLHDWINEKSEDEILERYGLGPGDLYNMKDTASWITHALSKISGIIGDISHHRKLSELSQRLDKGVKADALELASLKYIGRVRARILIEHGIKTLEDLAKTPRNTLTRLPSFGPRIVDEIHKQLEELGYKKINE